MEEGPTFQTKSEVSHNLNDTKHHLGFKNRLFLILLLFLLTSLIATFLNRLFFQVKDYSHKTSKIPLTSQSPTSFSTNPTPQLTSEITAPTLSVLIPKGWKEYTAEDPDLGIKITLSLPPGFSFIFSGSEFYIKDEKSEEIWDYLSSVFIGCSPGCDKNTNNLKDTNNLCVSQPRNHYLGGSRRLWYKKFLNGDFLCDEDFLFDPKMGEIISVDEKFIGNSSYLKVLVKTKTSEKETHYLYVQNNILHIIKPSSFKANSSSALLPKYIDFILHSLKSEMLI